ncbi:MAG: PAS domain S-box protein [Phaeodactylibacter sp.]|nr:PAS domain S-box protein [Phaeodactylibacter sp.]
MPLNNILKRSSDLIIGFDEGLKILHWNKSMEEHTGISRQNAVGEMLFSVLPGLKDRLDDPIRKLVLGERRALDYLQDLKIPMPSGLVLHASAALFPHDYTSNTADGIVEKGGVLLLYPFEKPSTYPPKLSKLLMSIRNYSSEAIIITNAIHLDDSVGPSIVYVNPAFTALSGYEEHEVLGKTPRILQGPDTDPATLARVKSALRKKEPVQAELLNYHKNGASYWIGLNIVPVVNEAGWTTHFIGVQRDITEKVELRRYLKKTVEERTMKLQQAVEDLEAFAYSASHDLKQPLRLITSHLGLLKWKAKGKIDPVLLSYIDEAVEGASRMYGLLEGVLQYSRITSVEDTHEPVDLQKVAEELVTDLKLDYPEKQIEVTFENQELPVVEGYKVHLEQVIQNLLSNAVKFADTEVQRIEIATEESEEEYRISVADNGKGIPEEDRHKLFQLFSTNHSDIKGTGIGLAICKRIIERHGGHIFIAPYEVGKGATFVFTLPKTKVAVSVLSPVE